MRSVVVHYQELALKGRNRPWFVDRLKHNLRVATAGPGRVARAHADGAHRARAGPRGATGRRCRSRLETVCGVANFSEAGRASSDLDTLGDGHRRRPRRSRAALVPGGRAAVRQAVSDSVAGDRADARRTHQAGDAAGRSTCDAPELTVHVEVLNDRAFYFFGKHRGVGGLPVGVSGRVACLLSGGIDSPVAAWRMMRRGCRAQLIHFHGYPFQSLRLAGQGARADRAC